MSAVTDNRWSCPVCGGTVTITGSEAAIRCCIRAEQIRHGRAHKAAARMPMPTPRQRGNA